MKVIEYGRVSTSAQDLQQQNRTVQEWLKNHRLKADVVIADEGVSGGVSYKNRKLGREVLPMLEPGDILIVAEISRLGRSMSDVNTLINQELKPRKVRLVIVQMGIDLNTSQMKAMDEMILYAFSFGAQIEKELIQERTKSALAVIKQKINTDGGFYTKSGKWRTSLGNNSSEPTKGGKVAGERKRKKALESQTNRIIAGLLKDAKTTEETRAVVEKLNEMGIKTTTGLEFTFDRLCALRTRINKRTIFTQKQLSVN